ncbi:unnamed protein product [Anisakis simplex]|uniref:ENTH domain-containing protein n=1 Tax=Anisakis simplex TaxID=6269 RepID=A0A0M3J120_ANISI|nr:unnamed protein product [Anisakis simplex]
MLQVQRCNFIRNCCDEYMRCASNATINSVIYQELYAKGRSLSAETRRCLEAQNKKYDGGSDISEQPYFDDMTSESKSQLSTEEQRRKLEAVLKFLNSRTQAQTSESITTVTTTPTAALTTTSVTTTAAPTTNKHVTWSYPTFPTLLPPLPNYFAILFPPLQTPSTPATTPQSTTKSSSTPEVEFHDDHTADISPVLSSVHPNQSDWASFCNESLSCEHELLKLETECFLKRSVSFDQEEMLDALITIKIIENTLDTESTQRARRTCQNTIRSEELNQLKKSFKALETKRVECIQRRILLQSDSIPPNDINETGIKMDHCESNILTESLSESLDSNSTYSQRQQRNSQDSWAEMLFDMRSCDELLEDSEQSRDHKFRMHQLLVNQRECERKMLAAIDSTSTESNPIT